MIIKFLIIFVFLLLIFVSFSVSGVTIKERKWNEVSSGWHSGGNTSKSDIDNDPEVTLKPDILPVPDLLTVIMSMLITIYSIILKRKIVKKEIIL